MPPRPQRMMPNSPSQQQKPNQIPGVLSRIEPIGFGDNDPIQVLVYGRAGSGKTTLWSTFPAPILAMICSGGINTGELRSVDTVENKDRINAVRIQSSTEVTEIVNAILAGQIEYNTIVLDHASGLQDLVLKEVLGLEKIPVQKSWGLARIQDYGQVTLQCKEIIRSILNINRNIYIVAQEREFNTDQEQQVIAPSVGAALMPQLTGWLNTAVDYILSTFIRQRMKEVQNKVAGKVQTQLIKDIGKVEYCARTAPDPVYTTKFRIPRGRDIPSVIVDPSYEKIMAVIKGEAE